MDLYERIIAASSNKGEIALDPFCGCVTSSIAAERLERQWVGMDICGSAHDMVLRRLESEGLAASDRSSDRLLTFGDVIYTTEPPTRTDDVDEAVPFLQVTERYAKPNGPRFLELEHNTPRSDGGLNHITNRILLCGPCNRLKSNQYTLSGLRRQNQRLGYMAR